MPNSDYSFIAADCHWQSRITSGTHVLTNKINVDISGLAVLPIDFLSRRGCPFEQVCHDVDIDPVYRDVFTAGIKAYQLMIYRQLIREHYGRGVANQIATHQSKVLEQEPGGYTLNKVVRLIRNAMGSDTVSADTDGGKVEIPIEMNIALSLLLGVESSPHCVNHPNERAVEITSMGLDIDWVLSTCLSRARVEMQDVFTPLLSCIESGVHIDYIKSSIDDRLAAQNQTN